MTYDTRLPLDRYGFGASITRELYLYENDEPINLPSQAPALYLFSTMPSLADALAGTGAVQTKAYWTHSNVEPFQRSYNWDPINDPDTGSGKKSLGYWEAVNFVRTSGGQTQAPILRYFEVETALATDSFPKTTVEDLKRVYPGIASYYDDTKLSDFLSVAINEMKLDLRAKGYEWHRFSRLDDLLLALAYKTISIAAMAAIGAPDDHHNFRFNEFRNMYKSALQKIILPYDTDNDGKPDTVKVPESGTITMMR